MSTSETSLTRRAIVLAMAILLTALSEPSQAALRPAGKVALRSSSALRPGALPALSLGWRKQYMLQHGWINHTGARGILSPLTHGKYLYVADYDLSVIFVYDATSKTNPVPLGFIADGVLYPAALAFDSKNNLYVANEGTSTVTVYAPGTTTVAKTVATIFPFALAFGPDGTLYVTGNDANAGNEVEIFAPNAGPTFIPTPNGYQSDGVAVSPQNVLTLTVGNSNSNGFIYTYPNGPMKPPVQVASDIGLLEGLAYDSKYLYASAYTGNAVLVFTPPSWASQTITNGIAAPIGLTVGASGLFVADSSVPTVAAYATIQGPPAYFSKDLVFVTATALSDATLTPKIETHLYLTAECNCSAVDIYRANPKNPTQTGTITRAVHTPSGVWMDDSANLWVANYGTHIVSELAAGTFTPIRFLNLNKPFAVAVDHAGTVYVNDVGDSNVAVFAPGSNTPIRTLTDCPSGNTSQYLTIDSANNMYRTCRTDIIKYAPGAASGQFLKLTKIQYATGVAIDANGNLYVADFLGSTVNVYAPKTTVPSRVITAGVDEPYQIAVGASGRLYVANVAGNSASIYAPGGSAPIGTIPGLFEGLTTGQ